MVISSGLEDTEMDYDQLATEYARHRQVHPGVLRSLLVGGSIQPASRVLEVGCGTGNYILALHSATGCAGWGIDPSTQMLAHGSQRPGKVVFQPGQAEKLDFEDEFFDLVFSVDVIHHVQDRPKSYQEAWRVLRPGGKICTVTDSEWIIRHRQPLSVYFPETVEVELKRYPPIASLRSFMEQAGFQEIYDEMGEFSFTVSDIQMYRDKAFSSLHLISEEAFQAGIRRMEADLLKGPMVWISRYVLLWGNRGG
jgi:ubiquinone/menaquinone biosynthesis C-methylase UbiE